MAVTRSIALSTAVNTGTSRVLACSINFNLGTAGLYDQLHKLISTVILQLLSFTAMDSYVFLETLGSGGFATVYKARNVHTGQMVAVKVLDDNNHYVLALREVLAMKSIPRHPNVLKLIKDSLSRDGDCCIILELMECSLGTLLRLQGGMDEAMVRGFTWQLLKGLSHIHRSGFIHRDLKPDNLLLDSAGVLKISDFGAASEQPFSAAGAAESATGVDSVSVGTLWYNAPEVLRGAHRYGPAVDMWAVGCIMAELFTGTPVFQTFGGDLKAQKEVILGWRRDLSLTELLPSASTQAVQLITALLSVNPATRPTALEALQHPFFEACRKGETTRLIFSDRVPSSAPATVELLG